jgi:predicted TIM-barrel fold metal-dependent hydrolase
MSSPDFFRVPPRRPLPPGATDCHAHVFGPYERFPLAQERSYTPPAAPFEMYSAMLAQMGLSRGVLVHPSAYGWDYSALLDALSRDPHQLRGIAVVDSRVAAADLARLRASGVRGVRFVESASANGQKFAYSVGLDQLEALGPRLREQSLHAEMWVSCDRLVAESSRLLAAGIPIVFDHMGGIDVSRGTSAASFQTLLRLLDSGQAWIKLSAPRNSQRFPDYEDVRPFHEALVRANPDRLIWGSDWPFIRLGERTPAVGHLLDLLDLWTGDDEVRRKILVDNPAALYGFTT